MIFLRFFFATLTTGFCSGLVASGDLTNDLVQTIDSSVKRMEKEHFSGCIRMELDGKVIVRKGYGYADRNAMKRNEPEMRFDIGSVTKPIVSAAVLHQIRIENLRLH